MVTLLLVLAPAAASADDSFNPFAWPSATAPTLVKYPVKLEADVLVTITADWHGQTAGCYAPDENGSQKIVIGLDTGKISNRRGRGPSKSIATAVEGSYGVTYGFGKRHGADQRGMPGMWDLRLSNPPPCDSPPVPPWATSPTCKRTKDRVAAWLQQSTIADDNGLAPLAYDGFVAFKRVNNRGRSINTGGSEFGGDSCLRFLPTSLSANTKDTAIGVSKSVTFVTMPVKAVDRLILRLSKGRKNSRPSVTKRFAANGPCNNFAASPSTGPAEGFTPGILGPAQALGSGSGTSYTCTVEVTGYMKLQRVGKVTRFRIPAGR